MDRTVHDQAETIRALQAAIQMEVDGQEFYRKASQKSNTKLAKELFQQLASEEEAHCKKFEEIHKALEKGQNWPHLEPPLEKGRRLRSLFAEATRTLGSRLEAAHSELEAIRIAIDMEVKSYQLYHSRGEESSLPVEKRFYEALAREERGHHLVLLDSYEYLTDPAGWFAKKEHWSLDGA